MISRAAERMSALTGFAATAAVGVAVLAAALTGEPGLEHGSLWWAAYALYLLVFLVVDERLPRPRWAPDDVLLLAQVGLGVGVYLLAPGIGWTAIVLVVSAAAVAFVWSPRAVAGVVAAQTLAVAVGAALGGYSAANGLLSVLAYGSFQGFAVLVVHSARREAESARQLAVAHAELRAASALLETTSRDAERLRIARELHDVVGHQLTALSLELEVASHLASGAAGDHVGRAKAIAKDLLGDVRATVGRLREPHRSLHPLLRSVVADLPGLDVDLEVDEEVPVREEQALAVVRCVQETVTNTLRHAGARRLTVRVASDADGVRVEASDDGRGAATVTPGNGLTGMRERFEALGGSLAVRTAPGAGFHVSAYAPVHARTSA